MKFAVSLILIILLSFIACLYFPWWSIAIAAFMVTAIIPQSAFMSFVTGFCAVFILWGVLSLWISSNNHYILTHKISLLILKVDNPFLLMMVSALIGALIAGFGALAGSFLRRRSSYTSQKHIDTAPGI